jgi:hypothetical protein
MLSGMGSAFPLVFLLGAAALALWIDARFPRLAPPTLTRRMLACAGAVFLLQLAPVVLTSAATAYATLFALVLPAFVLTFLTAAWIVRALGELPRAA